MRVALAQINVTVGDLGGNQTKIVDSIASARNAEADIIIFPELVLTGYPPEDLLLKEHFIKRNLKCLKAIALQVKGITALVGFVDADKKGIYNAVAILSDGQIKGVYHKKSLPNYSVFDEKRYFSVGENKGIFKLNGVRCGVSVCEDIWGEAEPCIVQMKAGAKVLFNLSSSPYELGKRSGRIRLLQERAKKFKATIAYVNLVGGQDELVFDGASLVVNAKGQVVASARQFQEDLLIYDIPMNEKFSQKKRISVQKRKPLSKLDELYQALVLGTHDYIQKNCFQKVVIGLSGGIDSTLVAAIAVDAVGKDNVIGISMPTRFNSKGTQKDARALAKNLGILFYEIPIEKTLTSYIDMLSGPFEGTKPGLAEENLQARIRGNVLMAMSNKFGWLVLTTGNKSEMAVGYCTLYGDMSGGYAVIKDVFKTKVYALCEFYNERSGKAIIPKTILTRPPSAELRDNQKDQDSLPPYDILDNILVGYVENHESFDKIVRRVKDKKAVELVFQLVDRSEYKRRQSPPGVKISKRAFGKDWRLPLTNQYKPLS